MDSFTYQFSSDWLQARFHADAQARNLEIQAAALALVEHTENPVLVDLGAGAGANFGHLLPHLSQPTLTYYWVDQDLALKEAAADFLTQGIYPQGKILANDPQHLIIQTPTQRIEIKWCPGDILELARLLDLRTVNLVTANAVFDLFSQDQFRTLAQLLSAHQVPLYCSINYQRMHFEHPSAGDATYFQAYDAHMQRPKSWGSSMGPTCVTHMPDIWGEFEGGAVRRGRRAGRLNASEAAMIEHLYGFMADSIPEMLNPDQDGFQTWWENSKRDLLSDQRTLFVEHQDFLLSWSC
ncbi:MAG: hypothetical protein AAF804_05415 [Bacteroidota bacterium]